MNTIIPVASGKGGVGKTLLCANIALALAAKAKTTVLADLDLGASNLHTLLGINNRHDGIGDLINTKNKELTVGSLVMPTDYDRVFLVPGDCLVPGTANLPSFRKKKLQTDLQALVADFVIADLSSGSSYNTVDFYLMSKTGIVVVTPQTTSILNAYSFIKTAVWRLLSRSYSAKSAERDLIDEFMGGRIERDSHSIAALVEMLAAIDESAAEYAREQLRTFVPRIVVNEVRRQLDIQIAARLRGVVKRNLSIQIDYIGYIPYEPRVDQTILHRRPAYTILDGSQFNRAVDALAGRLIGPTDRSFENARRVQTR